MTEMIDRTMTYHSQTADSDSASLGSNPSPPASISPGNPPISGSGNTGQKRTAREYRAHKKRHSLGALLYARPSLRREGLWQRGRKASATQSLGEVG